MEREDIELGDEPVRMQRDPHPGVVLSIRLGNEDARRLFALTRRTGRNSVELATDAVLAYLRAAEVPAGTE